MRNIVATVSRSALEHNLQRVKALAPHQRILAMIKANAYGHGLEKVCQALGKADAFGVACLNEAMIIRNQNLSHPIVLMEGLLSTEDLKLIAELQLTLVIHAPYQIDFLKAHQGPYKIPIWLKVNIGMNRLGFMPENIAEACNQLKALKHAKLIGCMGHYPCADDSDYESTLRQTQLFYQATKTLNLTRSLANSAAIIQHSKSHADWVRPGLMLYGASPFAQKTPEALNLKPVMEASSRVIALQTVNPGEGVGYGLDWICKDTPKTIAIVGAGYGDGYPWHAKSGTPVIIRGQRAPVCGRVSMDMLAVDVSKIPTITIGDEVTLWGQALPVHEIAKHAQTIPWEVFCRLTPRTQYLWAD